MTSESYKQRLERAFEEFRKELRFPSELERLSQPIHNLEVNVLPLAEKLDHADKCFIELTNDYCELLGKLDCVKQLLLEFPKRSRSQAVQLWKMYLEKAVKQ